MQTIELLFSLSLMILIWIIQFLHYPSFHFIDPQRFGEFELHHTKRISMIVMPLMLGEGVLSLVRFQGIIFVILLLIWLSTAFIQVPCHERLKAGYCEKTVSRLIQTNWIRTFLWSFKFFILAGQYTWIN
jgi:hypothetical protein